MKSCPRWLQKIKRLMELFHINIKFITNFFGGDVLQKFNMIGLCEKISWFCKNQLNWSKNTPTDKIPSTLANEPRLTLSVLLGRRSSNHHLKRIRIYSLTKKPILLGRYRMIKLTHVKKSILLLDETIVWVLDKFLHFIAT